VTAALLGALGTGLLGGFGHCAAMCGPLVAAVSLGAAPPDARGTFRLHLLYNLGRVTTYGFAGFVMGLAGSIVNVAAGVAGFQDAVAVAAGLLMVALGLGAAGVVPAFRRLEALLGGRVVAAARGLLGGGGAGRVYALGLLLGFLPCGLSWSAFAGAAATGHPLRGALFALAFGAGTAPALLLVGGAASWLSARARGLLFRAGGIAVAVLGLLFAARGLGLHAL
jgi:sulfite exporter TauE/SafE